ncbi:hypothetical protein Bbelb_435460 [Branchiostoma belcheri]|nr:hypothetical protein Bbelb_435460 [Branchiostoma belcheri]
MTACRHSSGGWEGVEVRLAGTAGEDLGTSGSIHQSANEQGAHKTPIYLVERGSQDVLADWEGVGPLAANAFLAADSATRDDASAEKIRLTELSNRRSKGAESHALNALKVTVGKVLAPEDNLSRARARARGMNCS